MPGERAHATRRAPAASRSPGGAGGETAPPGAAGNQELQRTLKGLGAQARLEVHRAGDSYEQEADRVADHVMRKAESPEEMRKPDEIQATPVQRKSAQPEEKKKDEKAVQKKGEPGKDDEKRKEEKPPVQKKGEPGKEDDKKKDEKDIQRKSAPGKDEERKKEEKPVQKKDEPGKEDEKKKEEKPVQKKSEPGKEDDKKKDEKVVQKKGEPGKEDDKNKKEEKPVQKSADGPTDDLREQDLQAHGHPPPDTDASLERRLDATRGGGSPLDEAARASLEPGFGRDLSGVRVHTDGESASLAKDLNAQAFTRGRDIYFGAGRYQPHTTDGRHLLAHELTHTLQQNPGTPAVAGPAPSAQRSGVAPSRASPGGVQRTPAAGPPNTLETGIEEPGGIRFASLGIPQFKYHRHTGVYGGELKTRKKGPDRTTDQRSIWVRDISKTGTRTVLENKAKAANSGVLPPTPVFQSPIDPQDIYFGDLDAIARRIVVPRWSRRDQPRSYAVDHIKEYQLGGEDTLATDEDNMELLTASVNSSFGPQIDRNIRAKAVRHLRSKDPASNPGRAEATTLLQDKHLIFNAGAPEAGARGDQNDYWRKSEIEAGDHARRLKVANASVLGREGHVMVFPSRSGGAGLEFNFTPDGQASPRNRNWLSPYTIERAQFNVPPVGESSPAPSGPLGTLTLGLDATKLDPSLATAESSGERDITVHRVPGAAYAGYIGEDSVRQRLNRHFKLKWASPLVVEDAEVTAGGIRAGGTITPSLSFLKEPIRFEMVGGQLRFSKTFSAGDLQPPSPFKLRAADLTVWATPGGRYGADGEVAFGIDGLGEGKLTASAGVGRPFVIQGEMLFTDLGGDAKLRVRYVREGEVGRWSGGAEFTVPDGKLAGVKSAKVTANYQEGTLTAGAEVEPKIRALRKGTLTAIINEQGLQEISGDLELAQVPGVQNGKLRAKVQRAPSGWSLEAGGEVQARVAGQPFTLRGDYKDGLFDLNVTTQFEKGKLSARITVGVTNRAVGEDGKPSGGPGEDVKLYGSGDGSIQFTPWLKGTAGITVSPEGNVKLRGGVALPKTFELMAAKPLGPEKPLFNAGFNFPVPYLGISVGSVSVGLFVRGEVTLKADAEFGPVTLNDAQINAEYDPDHEDQARITGGARLKVPITAGLRLSAGGSIGLGAAIASARGGLEVGGRLGVEGAFETGVNVTWSPAEGVKLEADAYAYAQPSFTFDITAFVVVESGPITWYEKRWELFSRRFGSGLRFGVRFPFKYSSQSEEGFTASFDDVKFEKPDINARDLMTQVAEKVFA